MTTRLRGALISVRLTSLAMVPPTDSAQAGMLASPLADGIALMRQRKFQSARDVLSPALIDAPSREAAAFNNSLRRRPRLARSASPTERRASGARLGKLPKPHQHRAKVSAGRKLRTSTQRCGRTA